MADTLRRASAGDDHRGHPVLRLRAPGPQGRAAHADHVEARRRSHPGGGRRPASSRSICTPDRSRASSTSPSITSTRMPVMLEDYLKKNFDSSAVFVSPDAGGVERARAYSKRLNASLAIIDKRRERANVCEVMHLIGDVKGKQCIIIDDMIDTAGTLTGAAQALIEHGATRVVACATHGVLSGPGDPAHRRVAARRGRRHRHHPALRGRQGLPEDQAGQHRPPPRRGHQAHPQLRLGQLAVRVECRRALRAAPSVELCDIALARALRLALARHLAFRTLASALQESRHVRRHAQRRRRPPHRRGKGAARRLRSARPIPAVAYGKGLARDAALGHPEGHPHVLKSERGQNTVLQMKVDGAQRSARDDQGLHATTRSRARSSTSTSSR